MLATNIIDTFVGVLTAQAVTLISPGPNVVMIARSSMCSLGRGLRTLAVLIAVVMALSAGAIAFGGLLGRQQDAVRAAALVGAAFLMCRGMAKLLAARWARLDGSRAPGLAETALTALSNPYTLVFYAAIVSPAAATGGAYCWIGLISALTINAAGIYGTLAIAFAHSRFRALFTRHSRRIEGLTGFCLLVFGARLAWNSFS